MCAKKKIPPLGGICTYEEAFRVGYTVDDNVELLKRYNYIKTRLIDIMSKHMNRTPEWEVKGAMSYHMWLDSEHATMIRKRVSEMREPPLHLDKVPDERLQRFMDEALHAATTVELVVGMYGVIRPALVQALNRHAAATNPLVDQPTCRILRYIVQEEEQMLAWGVQAMDALTDSVAAADEAERWTAHLRQYLQAAGGVDGLAAAAVDGKAESVSGTPSALSEPSASKSVLASELPLASSSSELPPPRANGSYEPEWEPKRDARFTDIWNNVDHADRIYKDDSRDPEERTLALLFKRLREMDVPEMMCSIIGQTPGKPWEYYHDMCRQIWDECRHSMMGEVGFVNKGIDWTKLPIRINWSYELIKFLTPLERHAVLYDIEFGLMPGDSGKKFEWEVTKQADFPLAVTFHDHDWADEVLHAQIGRKWFVSQMENHKEALALAQAAYNKIASAKPQYPIDNANWWDDFYSAYRT